MNHLTCKAVFLTNLDMSSTKKSESKIMLQVILRHNRYFILFHLIVISLIYVEEQEGIDAIGGKIEHFIFKKEFLISLKYSIGIDKIGTSCCS